MKSVPPLALWLGALFGALVTLFAAVAALVASGLAD